MKYYYHYHYDDYYILYDDINWEHLKNSGVPTKGRESKRIKMVNPRRVLKGSTCNATCLSSVLVTIMMTYYRYVQCLLLWEGGGVFFQALRLRASS